MQPSTKKKGEQAMSNTFEMRCPKCGGEDQIDVQAAIWVRLTSDGTDADAAADTGHDWADDSRAVCAACDYTGRVKDFEGEEDKAKRRRDAAPEMFKALELCVDALDELARLDDGTPSISALHLARAVLTKAR